MASAFIPGSDFVSINGGPAGSLDGYDGVGWGGHGEVVYLVGVGLRWEDNKSLLELGGKTKVMRRREGGLFILQHLRIGW